MDNTFTLTGRRANDLYTMQIEAARRGWAAFRIDASVARTATVHKIDASLPGAFVVPAAAFAR